MFFAFLKALLLVVPEIWSAVREGQVRGRNQKAVLDALYRRHSQRIMDAHEARRQPDDPGDDPMDRSQ